MIRRHFCVLLALLTIYMGCAVAGTENYTEEFVRLHVVAEDNSDEAQATKLAVRDACLICAQEILGDCKSAEEAYASLNENLPCFQKAAEEAAKKMGFSGSISVETGVFAFPDRIYGDLRVPAGNYRALQITLGSGSGHNWWCVLYPSLCGLDEAEYASAHGEVHFYSSLGRWLSKLFGGERT